MNVHAEATCSLWMSTARPTQAPSLGHHIQADVVVVGAGIAGLSVAYELARAGKLVVVVDRGPIGGGMTARTTAHLASAFDDYYHEYVRLRGIEEATTYFQSQSAAIDRIEDIASSEKIDCDFRRVDGYLFLAPQSDPELLERELQACHQVGFHGVQWADRAPVPGVDTGRCLTFPRQARFHPLKYIEGLARCIERDGGRLYSETAVVNVTESNGTVVVETEGGHTVHAGAAVVATNSPINDWIALHTKQAPYRTYVVTFRVPRGTVSDALCWDTRDPYHYVRIQPGSEHDWLIVGGEDHKTGEANDFQQRFAKLEAWTRLHYPQAETIEHRWSGQVMEPVDHVPYIGRNHGNEHVYISTGDSGEGITTGVVAGMLLRDLILGRCSAWAKAYAPGRVTIRAGGDYVRENLTMATNLAEHVTGGEISSVDELQPGSGAIIRQGSKKVAAYRDPAGKLHLHSAVCTHAGCIIRWNSLEICWDCPCHGSHFSVDGQPINGPAVRHLAEVKQDGQPA